MKLCYGLIVYSKYEQLKRLIDTLNVNDNEIVILVDKKSEDLYQKLLSLYKNDIHIHFVEKRTDIIWAHISQSRAVVDLLRATLDYDYDYFTMMSESCLPLYPDEEIKGFLTRHNGTEFFDVRFVWGMRSRLHLNHPKPYTKWQRKHRNLLAAWDIMRDLFFGWLIGKNKRFKSRHVATSLLWWTTTKECNRALLEVIDRENLLEEYKNTLMADEHIFAEAMTKTSFYDHLYIKGIRGAALNYCDWKTLNAPRSLRMKDYNKFYKPKHPVFYARKFDMDKNRDVVDKIYENRNNKDFKCPWD